MARYWRSSSHLLQVFVIKTDYQLLTFLMPSRAQLIQTDASGHCNELSSSFYCKALKLDPVEQAIGKNENVVKREIETI